MSVYEAFLKKYGTYTDIQKAAIGIIKENKNCIIVAPTGAGKTEAAVLPLIDEASRRGKNGIQIIYITPLRALNRDMISRLEWLCTNAGISIGLRHGDTTNKERAHQARSAPTLLVTTPETLQSILPTKAFSSALKNVKAVVVDEIHELYYNKRGAQLSIGLERLEELAPGFQRIGLSATISDLEEAKRFLCGKRACEIAKSEYEKRMEVKIEAPTKTSGKLDSMIDTFGLDKNALMRLEAIADYIRNAKSTLIFANTRQVVEAVGSRLMYIDKIEPFGGIGVHHGSLDRDERIRVEQDFKSGKIKALIATSSLELGIDIGSVDLVIQYGSPKQALRLIQRIGRSGHTRKGISRGFVIPLSDIDMVESMAVVENALKGELEKMRPNFNALDVLANQLCGIALDKGSVDIESIYKIIKRSSIYESMSIEKLSELLLFMAKQRLVGFDGKNMTGGPRTRMYYYEHLSVIPDSKRFIVKNILDNKIVSSLDEKFVTSYIDEGTVFITKGLPWKVVSIDERIISVEPSTEIDAAVPDWSGEDIPVSKAVANRVFELMGEGRLGGILKTQNEFFTPSAKTLYVEELGSYCCVYTGLGTLANEGLSRILAYIIGIKSNRPVTSRASPYMVLIEAGADDTISALKSIYQNNVTSFLEAAMSKSEIFRYRFIATAKLFGLIDKDSSVSISMANKIMRVLYKTPVYEETERELLKNFFDVDTLKEFAAKIKNGAISIELVRKNKISPLTDSILNSAYNTKELISPLMPSEAVVKSFVESVLEKSMKFLCTYCGYSFTRKLSEIGDASINCPSCGSPMIAPYSDSFNGIVQKKLGKKKLTKQEEKEYNEMISYAYLISNYGGRAAKALAVYGVGLKTAARVLMMLKHEEESFFLDLIEAQKTFIRTKKYWTT
ncbi:MAG: DEAD/DEAH box helicase [Candidatus Micrarchaeia archaeon]